MNVSIPGHRQRDRDARVRDAWGEAASMSASDLHVEVHDGDIIVTLPGTNFMVTYFKPAGTSHLIARPNWTNDPDASIELGEFLEQALTAANDKARELGWIV